MRVAPIRAPIRHLGFLLRPSPSALRYALRLLVTALLALLVSIALGLERPHWAAMTTIVVAQPTRGASWAKGFYRVVGSIAGAAAGVLMLTLLRPHPVALVHALSLWVGLSVVTANVLRSFRGYGAVLAAVTCPLVALMAFDVPSGALALGLVRIAEVLVGIVISGLMAALLVPQSDQAALITLARQLVLDGLDCAVSALRHGPDEESLGLERRLVGDLASLDDTADIVAAASPRLQARLPYVRGLMESVLSLLAAARVIELHLRRHSEAQQSDHGAALARLVEETRARLEAEPTGFSGAGAAVASAPAVIEALGREDSLREHVQELQRALDALEADLAALGESAQGPRTPAPPHGQLPLHRDWTAARVAGLRASCTLWLVGGVWLVTGWAGGGPMLMSASIMCAIFATHPQPGVGVRGSLKGASLAFLAALVFRLVLVPGPAPFYVDLLVATPLLFVGLLAVANRATLIAGIDFTMMFLFMAEPGTPWVQPPGFLLTTGAGIVLGVGVATGVFALLLPVDHAKRLQALKREIVLELQALAASTRAPTGRQWRARAFHRVLRLVLRAEPAGVRPEAVIEGGLAAIAVGSAILRLQQIARTSPPSLKEPIAAALDAFEFLDVDPARTEAAAREASRRLDAETASEDAAALAAGRCALFEIATALAPMPEFFRLAGHPPRPAAGHRD